MQTSYPGQGCKVLMKIWISNICCSVVMLPENGRLLCIWMIDDAPLKHILAAHIKYSAEFQHSQHHHCPEQWCTWPIINKYIQQCTVESWTAATIIIIRQLNRLMDSQQYDVMHCLSEKPHMFVSKISICVFNRVHLLFRILKISIFLRLRSLYIHETTFDFTLWNKDFTIKIPRTEEFSKIELSPLNLKVSNKTLIKFSGNVQTWKIVFRKLQYLEEKPWLKDFLRRKRCIIDRDIPEFHTGKEKY